jgi:hypothetical protein
MYWLGKEEMRERDSLGRFLKGSETTEEERKRLSQINLGRKLSEEHKQKIRLLRIAEKNPNWKGDKVGIDGLHEWLKRKLARPDVCDLCSKSKKLELCNISHTYNSETYTRDVKNWRWLCYSCHMTTDGRMYNNLIKHRLSPKEGI